MSTEWQKKNIGSITRKGTTERKAVINEDTGKLAGVHVEHWDGRQDAEARPDTIRVKVKVEGRNE